MTISRCTVYYSVLFSLLFADVRSQEGGEGDIVMALQTPDSMHAEIIATSLFIVIY
jgi:hypothetical protein